MSSVQAPRTESKVQFLIQILEEIRAGSIQVPRFQRPLRWDVDRQLELLRSVYSGIPIGALMLWLTNNTKLGYYRQLGAHSLPPPRPDRPRQYILDGVQRLSTLYGALFYTRPGNEIDVARANGETPFYDFFFDFEVDDFTAVPRGASFAQLELFPSFNRLPLWHVVDVEARLNFERELAASDLAREEVSRRLRVMGRLIKAFTTYTLAVICITTDELNLITRTFQLINSQGERMSELHMIHALTYGQQFDLRRRLAQLRYSSLGAYRGWQSFDDEWILRACKLVLKHDIFETDVASFSEQLRAQPEALERAVEAIRKALEFLRTRCGVWSMELLPYRSQVTVIAEALRSGEVHGEDDRKLLEAWFWLSSYGNLFTAMNRSGVQRTLDEMREMMRDGALRWTGHAPFRTVPLQRSFSWKSARSRLLILDLDRHMDMRENSPLATYGRDSMCRLIPLELLGNVEDYQSVGNIVLTNPDADNIKRFLRTPLLDSHEADQTLLDAHYIEPDAYEALQARRYSEFIDIRWQTLDSMQEQRMESLKERSQLS